MTELRGRLERIKAEEVMARALARQAERMATAVRDELSEAPGSGEHDRPWLESGALRESIGSQADGLQAAVGSSDPAAAPQEMGTSKMPARPFLAPVAAGMGEEVAQAVGAEMVAALREGSEFSDASEGAQGIVQVSASGTDTAMALLGVAGLALTYFALRRPTGPPTLHHSSPDGEAPEPSSPLPPLPEDPDRLLEEGWTEITHPSARATGHRRFVKPGTDEEIWFDAGKEGAPGYRAEGHYHVVNPNRTGKQDRFLDQNGRPVPDGSNRSHILPLR